MEISEYNTLKGTSEGYYEDKGSKFIALTFHVANEQEIKETLTSVRKKYHDARHHCYAFRIFPEKEYSRSSDDGEPSGTAGKPILNQILSYELYNILIIVIRYFGGTKLGVSGLIKAYKSAARDVIQNNKIIKSHVTSLIQLTFEYPKMNQVMRIIKEENIKIIERDFATNCKIIVEIKKNTKKIALPKFEKIMGIFITRLKNKQI